jgi:hypothetical protein
MTYTVNDTHDDTRDRIKTHPQGGCGGGETWGEREEGREGRIAVNKINNCILPIATRGTRCAVVYPPR